MFSKSKAYFLLTITAVISSMSSPAFSQRLVYDPKNHTENIITAIKTTASLGALGQIFNEAMNTNAGNRMMYDSFAKSVEMQQTLGLLDSLGQLEYALRQGKKSVENLQNVYGASPYKSWNEFAANISVRRDNGDKQALMLFDSANAADQQIRKAYETNRKIIENIKKVAGPTEAIQANVNAMSTVIDQNSVMLNTMSAQAKTQANELSRQAQEREQQETSIKDYKDAAKRAYEADAKLLGVRPR